MCKITIVEYYPLFSAGITSILKELEDITVVGKVENVDELIKNAGRIIPDVIIIDILHCQNSGVRPLRKIKRAFPKTSVLIITSADYADCFEEYIRIGVNGFIFGNAGSEELIKAIKKLKDGREYFPKDIFNIMKKVIQKRKHTSNEEHNLSDREVSVLKLFTRGLTYKEIGKNLNISPRTVETHRNNILSKLQITSTAEMIKYAYRNNMLT